MRIPIGNQKNELFGRQKGGKGVNRLSRGVNHLRHPTAQARSAMVVAVRKPSCCPTQFRSRLLAYQSRFCHVWPRFAHELVPNKRNLGRHRLSNDAQAARHIAGLVTTAADSGCPLLLGLGGYDLSGGDEDDGLEPGSIKHVFLYIYIYTTSNTYIFCFEDL